MRHSQLQDLSLMQTMNLECGTDRYPSDLNPSFHRRLASRERMVMVAGQARSYPRQDDDPNIFIPVPVFRIKATNVP